MTFAKRFFLCREMVVEVLRREVQGDAFLSQLVGGLALGQSCYPQWKLQLSHSTSLWNLAMSIFMKYPDSGCAMALQRGWRPGSSGTADDAG